MSMWCEPKPARFVTSADLLFELKYEVVLRDEYEILATSVTITLKGPLEQNERPLLSVKSVYGTDIPKERSCNVHAAYLNHFKTSTRRDVNQLHSTDCIVVVFNLTNNASNYRFSCSNIDLLNRVKVRADCLSEKHISRSSVCCDKRRPFEHTRLVDLL